MHIIGFLSLAASVLATVEPVIGSLVFYRSECPEFSTANGQLIKITPSQIEKPENITDIKSVYWVYPTTALQVQFFENRKAKKPYATITGTEEGFVGFVCNYFKPEYQVTTTVSDTAKGHDGLFLSPDSYYKVVRI
jgi:hypothetical protein